MSDTSTSGSPFRAATSASASARARGARTTSCVARCVQQSSCERSRASGSSSHDQRRRKTFEHAPHARRSRSVAHGLRRSGGVHQFPVYPRGFVATNTSNRRGGAAAGSTAQSPSRSSGWSADLLQRGADASGRRDDAASCASKRHGVESGYRPSPSAICFSVWMFGRTRLQPMFDR